MSTWRTVQLSEICDAIEYGHTTSATDLPVGPKFLRITDIVPGHIDWDVVPFCEISARDEHKYRLNHGDIVIARTGATTGYSAFVKEPPPAVFASYLIRLKVGSQADPRFVSYYLKSPAYRNFIEGVLGEKSAQPNASAKTLTQAKITLPPLEEQRRIAAILGALDDKIELNRQMNRTLEELARAIFKSWFVDFDPVHAKARGERPVGMDDATAALFPSEFEDSELGLIPKGWQVSTVGDLADAVGGSTPSTKDERYWNGEFHFTTPKDMSQLQSPVLFDTERLISSEGVDRISSGLLPIGTLLMSSRAPIGYLAITAVETAVNQGIIAMLPKDEVPVSYLWQWAHHNMGTIAANANGSTFLEISKRNFRPIGAVKPPDGIMRAYGNVVGPLLSLIESNARESRMSGSSRDLLLPELLSGRLGVAAEEGDD